MEVLGCFVQTGLVAQLSGVDEEDDGTDVLGVGELLVGMVAELAMARRVEEDKVTRALETGSPGER